MEGQTVVMMPHHNKVGVVILFLLTFVATVVNAYGQTNRDTQHGIREPEVSDACRVSRKLHDTTTAGQVKWAGLSGETANQRGFLIAVPNVIVRKSTAQICTTFHGILADVTITYKLRCTRRKTSYTQIASYPGGMDKCIDLHVPSYINKPKAHITASISLAGDPPSAKPSEYTKIVAVARRDYMVIIQTDKPLYKPGQTVRIRILSVTLDLRPQEEKIAMVYLEDPDGYRLTEWRNVRSRLGLAELEYPLAEDTTIGDWKLIVEPEKDYREMKLFNVSYYVLPDFEATVEAPKFLPSDGSSFVVRVCAKYIYGKAVVGNYTLVTCTRPTACQRRNGQLKGCMSTLIEWHPDITKPNELSSITVQANVTDIHTGLVMQSGKELVHSNGGRVTVDLKNYSAPYFKPGIPYSGKAVLKFLSGEPAGGAKLTVAVWHDGDPPDGQTKLRYRVTYSADAKGEVLFTLPKLSKKVNSFKLRAQGSTRYATRMLLKSTEALDFIVHAWYSPSDNYVQMESQPHLGTCVNSFIVNTTIVMPPSDGGNIRFHYQLLTNSGVLDTGSKDYTIHTQTASVANPPVQQRDLEFADVGPNSIKLRAFHDRWTNVTVIPNPYQRIPRYGRIVRWKFFSFRRVPGSWGEYIYLQVWRKDPKSGSNYTLVGQTAIPYKEKGTYVKALEGQEQIRVAPGDTLGIYFPGGNPVPFSKRTCSDKKGADKTLYSKGNRRDPNEAITFQPIISYTWIPCREYSLNAVVEVDDSLAFRFDEGIIPRHFMLDIMSPKALPPETHLLLYYVTRGKEVVSDVIRLDTYPCYNHKVSLNVRPTSTSGDPYPGDNVTMEIRADPGSLCAIGVVDRSVHAMEEPSYLDIDKIYSRIAKRLPDFKSPTDDCTSLRDAQHAFEIAGLSVMTDLDIKTTPNCGPGKLGPVIHCQECDQNDEERIDPPPGSYEPSTPPWLEPPGDDIRRLYPGLPTLKHRFYFPETWLWDTIMLGSQEHTATSVHTLPHTITEWAGNAFCIHSTSGLGVAPTSVIKAFQPFFISFSLPPTVIRDEVIPLQVTVNSYLDECFELALRLDLSESLALEEGGIEEVICMCEQNTVSLPYKIAPLDVGQINVTFSAEAVEGRDVCEWTDGRVVAMDRLTKPLTVLPEGIEEERTQTSIACVNDFEDEQLVYMNFTMPEHVVDDSQDAYITVTADVMGPTIGKIHKLLKLPTGCGEQNLAKLATNVQIMTYLDGTSQMTARREAKAKKYIAEGYQKVLKFRREDGSYSPFGKRDSQGSLWLTAFAIRTFAHARDHMYVEEDAFQRSIAMLQDEQLASGCFLPRGMIHNKLLLGGLNQTNSSPVGLSAYIMAALLDAGLSKYSPVLMHLVQCLDRQMPTDPYSLSIMAYAYSVYEPANLKRKTCLEKLFEKATVRGGLVYWKVATTPETPEGRADPIDIEVTSYVLLSLLASGTQNDLERGAPLVRWLTSQRNSNGGFASTQDTVVAVEALAKYATRTYTHETNLVVTMEGTQVDQGGQLTITSQNRLLAQRRKVPVLPAAMRFVITGTGCALIQGVSRYNVPVVVRPETYFTLDVEVRSIAHPSAASSTRRDCPKHLCMVRKLEICARYTGPGEDSNMAVVEIKMVTGWHPEENELSRLEVDPNTTVADTEYKLESSTVHLYFRTLTRHHECISMTVRQHDEVGNVQAAHVEVYDYYRTTDVGRVQTYQIAEICTEEEKDSCLLDPTIH